MGSLVAGVAALAVASLATPAAAYVIVEVTTSVAEADSADTAALKGASQGAVDDVLNEAVAFVPTLVVLTHARVVGDRLWLRLLIADQEGEEAFRAPHGGEGDTPAPPAGELRI